MLASALSSYDWPRAFFEVWRCRAGDGVLGAHNSCGDSCCGIHAVLTQSLCIFSLFFSAGVPGVVFGGSFVSSVGKLFAQLGSRGWSAR